jgi:hypothetical protein
MAGGPENFLKLSRIPAVEEYVEVRFIDKKAPMITKLRNNKEPV